ncbi:MAG: ATP-binding cassette domain-containing protein [Oscillospiraceae bacterium]|nr:ATP-binding cassette domain-containing protein [Oscillospiraceae bacterium]
MIEVQELTKVFRKPIRGNGLSGMVKTLFSRQYDEVRAVDGISFTVPDGEIVGYIGANGAGKSTTIKMMCGILTPSSGSVRIDGVEPYRRRRQVAQHIGVVFGQKTQLWWDIPLVESFKVLKEIYQISDADYTERMRFLGEVLDITRFLSQPVRTLSLGERMRADLAASMLHNPRILFLDEPTIGMDVLVKEKIRLAVHALNKSYGTTVVLTTHDMTDIENLCSRIILLEKGSILYDGPLYRLKNRFGNLKTLTLTVPAEIRAETAPVLSPELAVSEEEGRLVLRFDADKLALEQVIQYAFRDLRAMDMKLSEISIGDVVKTILAQQEAEHAEKI